MPASDPSLSSGTLRDTVSGFVHAVRNPLAVIRSSAQVAQRLGQGAHDVSGYLSSVVAEVDRIEAALQGLQRLARLEGEHGAVCAAEAAIAEACAAVRERARAAGITVELRPGPGSDVRTSTENLEQAVGELLDNAIRHTPAGSSVEVSWRRAEAGQVEVNVDDRGPGIAPELAETLPRPFRSSDRARLGLGLALAARVCALAGGCLRFENREGGGCRFILVLPAAGE
jgi:signal transduction histidine kinase